MDEKLLPFLPLVSKLASTSLAQQQEGARDLRVLAKTKPEARIAIARSGAVPLLLKLLLSSDEKLQENSVTALLNLSLCDANRSAIVQAKGSLDSLLHALASGYTTETRQNAAAVLFSLMICEDYRPVIGRKPGIVAALFDLLRNESPQAQKDALRALFHIALCDENRPFLVASDAVSVLISMLSKGNPNPRVDEDVLAVLAQLARSGESLDVFLKASAIPLFVDTLETGSLRAKENAASALLNLCQSGGYRAVQEVLDSSCSTSLSMLMTSGSPRGRSKASALLQILVVGLDR